MGLRDRGSDGRLAASHADNAEDGYFGEGGARDEDTVGGGIPIGRSDLDTVVQQGKKVVGDDALEGFVVGVAQADPQAVQFWAAEEGLAFGFEIIGKLADKVDGTYPGDGNRLVFAIGREQVEGTGLSERGRIQIAADRFFVGENDDNLLVRGGWGSGFQEACARPKERNLRNSVMYVMLSAPFLSSYCFY